jgi:hypothetical protein
MIKTKTALVITGPGLSEMTGVFSVGVTTRNLIMFLYIFKIINESVSLHFDVMLICLCGKYGRKFCNCCSANILNVCVDKQEHWFTYPFWVKNMYEISPYNLRVWKFTGMDGAGSWIASQE